MFIYNLLGTTRASWFILVDSLRKHCVSFHGRQISDSDSEGLHPAQTFNTPTKPPPNQLVECLHPPCILSRYIGRLKSSSNTLAMILVRAAHNSNSPSLTISKQMGTNLYHEKFNKQ